MMQIHLECPKENKNNQCSKKETGFLEEKKETMLSSRESARNNQRTTSLLKRGCRCCSKRLFAGEGLGLAVKLAAGAVGLDGQVDVAAVALALEDGVAGHVEAVVVGLEEAGLEVDLDLAGGALGLVAHVVADGGGEGLLVGLGGPHLLDGGLGELLAGLGPVLEVLDELSSHLGALDREGRHGILDRLGDGGRDLLLGRLAGIELSHLGDGGSVVDLDDVRGDGGGRGQDGGDRGEDEDGLELHVGGLLVGFVVVETKIDVSTRGRG